MESISQTEIQHEVTTQAMQAGKAAVETVAESLIFPIENALLLKPGISQTTYDDLVRYTKYSSAAYHLLCLHPLARDDHRKEIVVAFRGSQDIADFMTDAAVLQIPLILPGLTNHDVGDAFVHSGFLFSFNSVARQVLSTVNPEIGAHPGYTLISTGHSLGGALASLGALCLKANFPNVDVKLFTFGQPRTGNATYAALVDKIVGLPNSFRGVHTFDGVPTIIPQVLGYRHHGTEFWQYREPPNASNTTQCSGDEDPAGSTSIPSTGINIAHVAYFGQVMSMDPSVCVMDTTPQQVPVESA
ncbi:hypothetical protein PLICRDRAFT_482508 [Plicaturopsis crispa FD-325 SS-3]|nr:hypothetical protein PLICRDRAFT_482508 [Plicaturopsis crispa FD-325 SS-3]